MSELSPRLLVNGYAGTDYNIIEFDGRFYGIHREEGSFDIGRIGAGTTKLPAHVGNTLDEVARKIEGRLDEQMLRDIVTGFAGVGAAVSSLSSARTRMISCFMPSSAQ